MLSLALFLPFAAALSDTLPVAPLSPTAIDTTVAVSPSAQLRVEASAGRITVRVWDKSAVRLVATPTGGTEVRIAVSTTLVHVSGQRRGRIDDAEYELTVPRRMALTLGSGDVTIDVDGSEADVSAKNYSGQITVSHTKGALTLKSALGEVSVQNAIGRVAAQSLYSPVRLTDVVGDVNAEGSANHIYLTRVDARTLSASTVSGVIWFTGPLRADGHYELGTHSGSVFLTVPEPVNATLHVSTVSGGFASALPSTREDGPRRGRYTVKFGTGAASVDVETFNGGIVVRTPEPEKKTP